MIRVLLVDDHTLVRAGLERLLVQAGDIQVVASANCGEDAIALDADLRPDVVLMDLSMPGIDGIETTRRLRSHRPEAVVVMLTANSDGDRVVDALNAGAVGYLIKDSAPTAFIDGVHAAAQGESPLDPRAAKVLINKRPSTATSLTPRESEVLTLVGRGLSNREIARKLGIKDGTVKAHLTRIFAELGVSGRTQAALWMQEHIHE